MWSLRDGMGAWGWEEILPPPPPSPPPPSPPTLEGPHIGVSPHWSVPSFFGLPRPSRLGSRIEISAWYSEDPAQNCVTALLYFHKNRENRLKINRNPISGLGILKIWISNGGPKKSKFIEKFKKSPKCMSFSVKKLKFWKFDYWDGELRIARIDRSRLVSMDETRE